MLVWADYTRLLLHAPRAYRQRWHFGTIAIDASSDRERARLRLPGEAFPTAWMPMTPQIWPKTISHKWDCTHKLLEPNGKHRKTALPDNVPGKRINFAFGGCRRFSAGSIHIQRSAPRRIAIRTQNLIRFSTHQFALHRFRSQCIHFYSY